ncbi:MAG: S49 family peptidase, partial [Candidatus Pacebacteria bacterium CG_4_10_14_0_8_um_filter_43_12]
MKRFFVQLFKVAIFSSVGVTSALFTLLVGIIVVTLIATGFSAGEDSAAVSVSDREYVVGKERSTQELLVIPISGVIMGEAEPVEDWLAGISTGVTYGYQVKEELAKAAEEPNIKGILLQINSPGGTIYGSNAILDGVTEYKQKTGKPVVAYVNGLAASGAYWSAIGADKIVADTGTTIGSIGVIFGPFKYYDSVVSEDGGLLAGGVVTQKGIQTTYITAGKSKDLGNPYRQLTQEELGTLQNMVNQAYD